MIVRRLDTLVTQECPKRWLQIEKVLTECRRLLIICKARTFREENLELLPDRLKGRLESGAVDSTLFKVLPDHEKLTGQFLGSLADSGPLSSTIDQLLKVSEQVRPADLAEATRPDPVGFPAVGGEDPTENSSQKRLQSTVDMP